MRGPELSSRVSIHSPPRLMFSAWRCAHSSCSVMPGRSCCCITAHRRLAGRERAAHGPDLVGALDRARELHDLLALVHARARAPRALRRLRGLTWSIASRRLPPPCARTRSAISAAQLRACSAMRSPLLKKYQPRPGRTSSTSSRCAERCAQPWKSNTITGPVGRDEGVAHRVVQAPDLHVGAVGGVAEVDRVGDHDAGIVARGQLRAHAVQGDRPASPPGRAARARAPATRRARARRARGRRTSRARAAAPRPRRSWTGSRPHARPSLCRPRALAGRYGPSAGRGC